MDAVIQPCVTKWTMPAFANDRRNPRHHADQARPPVAMPGLLCDATLHAVFLGFVISMVFAHAPVIFPAVLGLPLVYRPAFYLHVGVLHVSLILRVVGDLVDTLGRWWVWGGFFNAAALLLFMFNTSRSMVLKGNHGNPI
jgi:hypothetical protein